MTDTTTAALRKAGTISDEAIDIAAASITRGEERADFPIANGYTLDIPKALAAKPNYRDNVARGTNGSRRNIARTAVLLAKLDPA